MFVKLLTDVNGLYILWVSAEMAYNFYNISAGCPMQIDFNLKHWYYCDFATNLSSDDIFIFYKETSALSFSPIELN